MFYSQKQTLENQSFTMHTAQDQKKYSDLCG